MKIKKAASCLVEMIVSTDGDVKFITRLPNGQPADMFDTPEELAEFFRTLSQDEPQPVEPFGAAD